MISQPSWVGGGRGNGAWNVAERICLILAAQANGGPVGVDGLVKAYFVCTAVPAHKKGRRLRATVINAADRLAVRGLLVWSDRYDRSRTFRATDRGLALGKPMVSDAFGQLVIAASECRIDPTLTVNKRRKGRRRG